MRDQSKLGVLALLRVCKFLRASNHLDGQERHEEDDQAGDTSGKNEDWFQGRLILEDRKECP